MAAIAKQRMSADIEGQTQRDYRALFARLDAALAAADCSNGLRAEMQQIARAPVWNDEATLDLIDTAQRRIEAELDDGGRVNVMIAIQREFLAQLRGEEKLAPAKIELIAHGEHS